MFKRKSTAVVRYKKRKSYARSKITNFGFTFPQKGVAKLPYVTSIFLTSTDGAVSNAGGVAIVFDRLEDLNNLDVGVRHRPRGYAQFFGPDLGSGPFNSYKVTGVSVNLEIVQNTENDTPFRLMIRPFSTSPVGGITNGVASTTNDGADWEEWGSNTYSTIITANRQTKGVQTYKRYFSLKKLYGKGWGDSFLTRLVNPDSVQDSALMTSAAQFDDTYQSSASDLFWSGLQIIMQSLDESTTTTCTIRAKMIYHVIVSRGTDIITDTISPS